MNILLRKREFVRSILAHVPSKLSHLITFGCTTLVAQSITSSRANARRSTLCWATAKSKMWRLLANAHLSMVFASLITNFVELDRNDIVCVDFSDFGDGRQVLLFAKQTRDGRALPLYFEILEYPINKGSQNLFVVAAIRRFYTYVGCTPTLVFDRGFAAPHIVQFLARNKHRFVVRIKAGKKLVTKRGVSQPARAFRRVDATVWGYECWLRLVISDDPGNGNERWYLLTNDMRASRQTIIRRYYHRFEIEEFFRDAKHILGFEHLRFKTARGLSVALWFALLTCWFFAMIAAKLTYAQEKERARWRVSRFRYVYEKLMQALWRQSETPAALAVSSGTV